MAGNCCCGQNGGQGQAGQSSSGAILERTEVIKPSLDLDKLAPGMRFVYSPSLIFHPRRVVQVPEE